MNERLLIRSPDGTETVELVLPSLDGQRRQRNLAMYAEPGTEVTREFEANDGEWVFVDTVTRS